jgi:hypothetical protein
MAAGFQWNGRFRKPARKYSQLGLSTDLPPARLRKCRAARKSPRDADRISPHAFRRGGGEVYRSYGAGGANSETLKVAVPSRRATESWKSSDPNRTHS